MKKEITKEIFDDNDNLISTKELLEKMYLEDEATKQPAQWVNSPKGIEQYQADLIHSQLIQNHNIAEKKVYEKALETKNAHLLAESINRSSEMSDKLSKVNLLLTFFGTGIAGSTFLLQYFSEYKQWLWLVWVIILAIFFVLNQFYIHRKNNVKRNDR